MCVFVKYVYMCVNKLKQDEMYFIYVILFYYLIIFIYDGN